MDENVAAEQRAAGRAAGRQRDHKKNDAVPARRRSSSRTVLWGSWTGKRSDSRLGACGTASPARTLSESRRVEIKLPSEPEPFGHEASRARPSTVTLTRRACGARRCS